jgi:hypothetical protein
MDINAHARVRVLAFGQLGGRSAIQEELDESMKRSGD